MYVRSTVLKVKSLQLRMYIHFAEMKYFVLLAVVTVFFSSVLAGGTFWLARGGYSFDAALNNQQLSASCNDTLDALPAECVQYLYADYFDSTPCSETCGRPLYNVYQVCDIVTDFNFSALFDLQCTKNKAGKRCADVFNDFDFECGDASPESCPASCTQELKQNDIESDCCLYTLFVVFSNTTFADDLLDECGVDHTGSCSGAFSGEPIVFIGYSTVTP